MVKAKIFSLIMVPEAGQYLITLEEIEGTRLLPIWIGPSEGVAIAAALQNHDFPRPLTHDLITSIFKGLKVKIQRVIINDIKENAFYASIILKQNAKVYCIDARPSDSIALATKCNAPILIKESVLEKCPIIHKPITKIEIEKFKKDLEKLRPEDFFREAKDG